MIVFFSWTKNLLHKKGFHLTSFWKWEFLELGNGMSQSIAIFVIIIIIIIYLFIYLFIFFFIFYSTTLEHAVAFVPGHMNLVLLAGCGVMWNADV